MTVAANEGLEAEAGSPVLLPADPVDAAVPLRWTGTALAVATLLLAATNAATIGEWVDELPQGAVTERLRPPVAAWIAATRAVHLDAPRTWLRGRWHAAQALRFGNEGDENGGAAADQR